MENREHILISAIGPDRVGLVQRIAGLITDRGANIEDSNMAALCGEFAIIMLASGPPRALATLQAGCEALSQSTGLTVSVRRISTAPERAPKQAVVPCTLTASCLDHPGVVHRLTSVISEMGVNIEAMHTGTERAPESGAPIFRFEARLSAPPHVDLSLLREQLEAIGRERNIDVRLDCATA